MNKKIIISFSIAITLLLLLGFTSIVKMIELSDVTQKLYKHPFAVSNATKTIEINLTVMHRLMQEIVSTEDITKINELVNTLNANELVIYKEFEIVFDRYLGDKNDIQLCYDSFVRWKPIRDRVVYLMKLGKMQEAVAITKNQGVTHLKYLQVRVNKMIEFANNKAEYFQKNALNSKKSAIILIAAMLVSNLIIIISVLVLLIKNISQNEKKLKEHFHVIDQNIMSATLNEDYIVIDSSNALARHLGLSKDELLSSEEYSLFSDCDENLQKEIKVTVKSGEEWRGEILKVDANNEKKWLDSHISPIFNNEYQIVGYTNILHDISARKKIEEISRLDGLTNLYNRRFFDETFPKAIKIAKRQGKLLVFAMIDIDHFKQYNDTYGHQAGDTALKEVAKVLKSSLNRPDDYTFRLGGEEFGMLYMLTDEEDAMNIATEALRGVEKLHIPHELNSASDYVTISIGIYVIKESDDFNSEDIYLKSDEALYEAKQNGKNQIQKV